MAREISVRARLVGGERTMELVDVTTEGPWREYEPGVATLRLTFEMNAESVDAKMLETMMRRETLLTVIVLDG